MIGKTLGHYQITSQLGKGGMGEVYQATDQVLGREVAIKVLPDEFARDADRVARFQREAKLLASLNHPNIAAIHGLEESGGTNFLVLELVEGETLADRIKTGPIPVEESLKLALQIAEALESAHEKGVIHRDLKPANIKVTPDGKVKVLDFGLAKAFAGQQEALNLSNSPTLSNAATQQGVILGTAAYMSPEQAKGKAVDRRADIWAFGAVVLEMLTGKPAFPGEEVSEIIASVIKGDVKLDLLPVNIHPRVREAVNRCLQKDSRKRYSSITEARYEIEAALADPSGVFSQPAAAAEPGRKLRRMLPWIAAAIVLAALITGVAVWKLKPPEPRQVMRFEYELPKDSPWGDIYHQVLAVSPDGTHFVYSTTKGLYLRAVYELDAKFIVVAKESPTSPFFSPDGQWIGYFSNADQKLKKIAVHGGAPVALCDVTDGFVDASWGPDDTILYSQYRGPIMRVPANGGNPETLVKADGNLTNPQILPDGKTVLFTQWIDRTPNITLQSAKTGKRKVLVPGHSPKYLPTGHIVYSVGNNLLAVPFDLDRLEVLGAGVHVVEGVSLNLEGWLSFYAVSDSGTLVYRLMVDTGIKKTLVWRDRDGREAPLGAQSGRYSFPKISPDGTRIAITNVVENADILIWDLVRKNFTKLTFDEGNEITPIWTPEGKQIIYTSLGDKGGIYRKNADGTGPAELLISAPDRTLWPYSWSRDGKTLVMGETKDAVKIFDISILSLEGDHVRKPLLQDNYVETLPQISPDGKWIAYCSNESGQNEVFVRAFPDVDKGKCQVSTNGGVAPLWSRDGKEIFYLNASGNTVAVVGVKVETEPSIKPGSPTTLFQGAYDVFPGCPWDIHPDGQRFLMIKPADSTGEASADAVPQPKIIVVTNWFEELKRSLSKK